MLLRMAGLASLFLACILLETATAGKGRTSFNETVVDGVRRSYSVYEPIASVKKKFPLMIVLHGGLGNAKQMEKNTAMNDIADTGPFVVVYPNGVKIRFSLKDRRTWNAGNCCGKAAKKDVDDVKFIEKIIEEVGQKIPIDTQRVYVTGMSNGAMMAYRLAAEIPDRIAAVIAVAGTLAVDSFDAARNIPVLHIHGTADENVPIAGGKGALSVAGVAHRSLSDTVELITRSRQCSDPEVKKEKGRIQISTYRCSNGAPLVLILIEGGKHEWPGGRGRRQKNSGSHHFSASKQAWEFAKRFSKTSN